ncbi:AbrB family transcriptional regulator [Elstera sp.]|jgi:putative addiction module antidote|uniref:AbrB family transcriptional regulator n=1 Tax=Elstera sp. TaxID=1916664 RepID=UPI0037BF6DD1
MVALKLQRIGDEIGVILPKEALDALGLGEGGTVYVSEAPNEIAPSSPDVRHQRQLEAAREIMQRRRDVLRVLAQ